MKSQSHIHPGSDSKRWLWIGMFLLLGILGEGLHEHILAQPVVHEQAAIRENKIRGACAALNDAWPDVQARALDALVELDALESIPAASIPRIGALLQAQDDFVRLRAIQALREIGGPAAKEFLPQIGAFLVHRNEDVRAAAIEAIGQLGVGSEDIYLPQLLTLFETQELPLRLTIVRALQRLDPTAQTYLPHILTQMTSPNPAVRADAAALFGNVGEPAQNALPQLMALLNDPSPAVRREALRVLGNFGLAAHDALPQVIPLLQDKQVDVRVAALKSLSQMRPLDETQVQEIRTRLQDQEADLRAAAVWALGELRQEVPTAVSDIMARLDDAETQVRVAAIEVLGALGKQAEPAISKLAALLTNDEWEIRAAAVTALGELGTLAQPAFPEMRVLLRDQDWLVRSNAVKALGRFVETGQAQVTDVLPLLADEDGNVRSAATWVLGNLGTKAKPYHPQLLKLLTDPHSGVQSAAVRAFANLGGITFDAFPSLLNIVYIDPTRTAEIRFLAHVTGAGQEPVEMILHWLGNPGENYPTLSGLSATVARQTLHAFEAIWSGSLAAQAVHADLVKQTNLLFGQMDSHWQASDLPLLRQYLPLLSAAASPWAKSVRQSVWTLTIQRIVRSPFFILGVLCVLHPVVWLLLLLVYPYYSPIRRIFFWNPYGRKILGLGYIHMALVNVSAFRQRLFRPFRRSLLADAALEHFNDPMYFKASTVYEESAQYVLPIHVAIPEIEGKIVLKGESGLGKTMFARYLLKYATRAAVYVPAEKCAEGLIDAIRPKLRGEATDVSFLKDLVRAGAIDVCIDGLDALSAKHRAQVVRFLTHSMKGNVLITTRATEWTPSEVFVVYEIQPVAYERVEEVLKSCYRILPENVPVAYPEYVATCKAYLERFTESNVPLDVLAAIRQALSNPMNLSLIALLLAYGKEPAFAKLPEQCYQLLAEEYQRQNQGQPFPLVQFAERVYLMRLNDEASIPYSRFAKEIACLESYRMILSRNSFDSYGKPVTEYYFRHEKIVEFFIAQAFLNSNHNRIEKHHDDPRFYGVSAMLKSSDLIDARSHDRSENADFMAENLDDIEIFEEEWLETV